MGEEVNEMPVDVTGIQNDFQNNETTPPPIDSQTEVIPSHELPPNFGIDGDRERKLFGFVYGLFPQRVKDSLEKSVVNLTYPSDHERSGDGHIRPPLDDDERVIKDRCEIRIGECVRSDYFISLSLHELGHALFQMALKDNGFTGDERDMYEIGEMYMDDYRMIKSSHTAVDALQLWVLYPKVLNYLSGRHLGWRKLNKLMESIMPISDADRDELSELLAGAREKDDEVVESVIKKEIDRQKELPLGVRRDESFIKKWYERISESQRTPPIKNFSLGSHTPDELWVS